MTKMTLAEIFQRNDHDYDALHHIVEEKIERIEAQSLVNIIKKKGAMSVIDLEGKIFVIDRPLVLKMVDLLIITNGTIIAGPDFPQGEYLIQIEKCQSLHLSNLFLECSKVANGICLQNFFRIRIEDCYIIHQKKYGIYSSPIGGNHELEVFKCHIVEYLFGDGYPKKKVNYGVIPEYDIDENRVSTGIFLGQADNVVADCNINLCKTGIFVGMRANRIHGNHITGGGSKDLSIFKGIELNNFHKSSAMITNNYIDNCCLWINCSADVQTNMRNYFHVTDNLFYRGYNHPRGSDEKFHHIVINPMENNSLIANLHICDNNFYNQPENLNGIESRTITPIHINTLSADNDEVGLDHEKLVGISMKNNYFTNVFPTFVRPMGTEVSKIIDIIPNKEIYRVVFEKQIPLGIIRTATVTILGFDGEKPPVVEIKKIQKRTVTVYVDYNYSAKILIKASSENAYAERFDYIVD